MTADILGRDRDEQMDHFVLYAEWQQMAIMKWQAIASDRYRRGDHAGAAAAFQAMQDEVGEYMPFWLSPYRGKKF